MPRHPVFHEPHGSDFLVVGDFEPPIRAPEVTRPRRRVVSVESHDDAFGDDWGSFAEDLSDPSAEAPPPLDPDLSSRSERPGVCEGVASASRRAAMVVRRSTRRLYAEGLPVVFGPAPRECW